MESVSRFLLMEGIGRRLLEPPQLLGGISVANVSNLLMCKQHCSVMGAGIIGTYVASGIHLPAKDRGTAPHVGPSLKGKTAEISPWTCRCSVTWRRMFYPRAQRNNDEYCVLHDS